jgi:hypothetical protein
MPLAFTGSGIFFDLIIHLGRKKKTLFSGNQCKEVKCQSLFLW